MNDPNLIEITKKEIHYWPACPCEVCRHKRAEEAARRTPSKQSHRRLSVEAAYTLSFIRTRRPHGSVARELMLKQTDEKAV